ncbi:MAG: hypothetical protein ABIL01_24825 [Pseudomonadota bacterium]
MPFSGFPKSKIDIVSPDGNIRSSTQAIFGGDVLMVQDTSVIVEPGDEIRRTLPNGHEEVFEVVDPRFYDTFHGIAAHYQIKIRRRGTYPKHTGGHYSVHVSGNNARVNIHSLDHSTNTVNDGDVFKDIIKAFEAAAIDRARLEELKSVVEEMRSQKGKAGFAKAYQKFIGLTADHIGVVTPFLPALAGMIG